MFLLAIKIVSNYFDTVSRIVLFLNTIRPINLLGFNLT